MNIANNRATKIQENNGKLTIISVNFGSDAPSSISSKICKNLGIIEYAEPMNTNGINTHMLVNSMFIALFIPSQNADMSYLEQVSTLSISKLNLKLIIS